MLKKQNNVGVATINVFFLFVCLLREFFWTFINNKTYHKHTHTHTHTHAHKKERKKERKKGKGEFFLSY